MEIVITSVATAIWAVATWSYLRINEHIKERNRVAALYVNPFILACEELQSRIFNIINKQGLKVLKKHYPAGDYAAEILYLIAQYFAWEHYIYRYGPYTRDKAVIKFTERIRAVFATDHYGLTTFCFFRPEQRALGQLLMRSKMGEHGYEFETISFYEFKKMLGNAPLDEMSSIKDTISELQSSNFSSVSGLSDQSCKRLAEIQRQLVGLLNYLEKKEKFSLFVGSRKEASCKEKEKSMSNSTNC